MLTLRGLEVVETGFCMYDAFKLVMRIWRRYGSMPKASIWCLSLADRLFPIGSTMDLMVLAQLPVDVPHAHLCLAKAIPTDAPQSRVA